jgi:hypothetical protein
MPSTTHTAEMPYADEAGAPATYRPHPASHNSIRDSATEPHSFSIAVQRTRRRKKKPGANEHTASRIRTAASWNGSTSRF